VSPEESIFYVVVVGWLFGGVCGYVVSFVLRLFGGTIEATGEAFKEEC
jgi:hypothetical protein